MPEPVDTRRLRLLRDRHRTSVRLRLVPTMFGPPDVWMSTAWTCRSPADFAVLDAEIARLIRLLDDDSSAVAEDARAALFSTGAEVVRPLAAAVPSLERFGQLSAIEAFGHLGDPAAGPALIDLLSSENCTVREWSAQAIEQLGVRDAVPALWPAYRRLRGGDGRSAD